MTGKVDKLARVSALVKFREKYAKQDLEDSRNKLIAIRDSKKGLDKDIINAIKALAQLHGVQVKEKIDRPKTKKDEDQSQQKLTKAEEVKIEELLNGKYSLSETAV